MAVQFELYKTPMPKEKKNKTRYHARPVSFETVNTEKLAYRIHDRSTLRVSDIISTLEELKNEVAQCLLEGKKVHVDGLGFFQVTLSCEEEIRNPKDKRVHRVKLKAIKFKADKELKGELCHMKFQRSKIRPHSANLSEVDRHIKRLMAEKKLQNKGTIYQPIYTPVPGNYRVSVDLKYKER